MIDSDLARSPQAARPPHSWNVSTLETVGSPLLMVSKRSCHSGTKVILCRVLENDYQRLVPLRQRGLGVIGGWKGMASLQAPFFVSAASSAMPTRLIFFSVVLVCFHTASHRDWDLLSKKQALSLAYFSCAPSTQDWSTRWSDRYSHQDLYKLVNVIK